MNNILEKIKNLIMNKRKSPTEKEFDRLVGLMLSTTEYKNEINNIKPHRHYRVVEIENEILKSLEENPDVFTFQGANNFNLGMLAAQYNLDEVVKLYITDDRVNRQKNYAGSGIGKMVMYHCPTKEMIELVVKNRLPIFNSVYKTSYLNINRRYDESYERKVKEIYPDFDMYTYEEEVLEFEQQLVQKKMKSQKSNTQIEIDQDIVESQNDGQDFE